MKEIVNEFDVYLAEIVSERIAAKTRGEKKSVSVRLPSGHIIFLDPVDVLHVLLKGTEIDELSDIDSDEMFNMIEKVKGKIKGGKIGRRDKNFGLPRTDPFWDWWHLHSKAHYGGRDIQSKSELVDHLENYKRELNKLFTQSFLRIAINRLNSKKRKPAKKILKHYFNMFVSSYRWGN